MILSFLIVASLMIFINANTQHGPIIEDPEHNVYIDSAGRIYFSADASSRVMFHIPSHLSGNWGGTFNHVFRYGIPNSMRTYYQVCDPYIGISNTQPRIRGFCARLEANLANDPNPSMEKFVYHPYNGGYADQIILDSETTTLMPKCDYLEIMREPVLHLLSKRETLGHPVNDLSGYFIIANHMHTDCP